MKRGVNPLIVSVLILALTGTVVYAGYQNTQKNDYQRYLENSFQEAFYETTYYVSDVENMISKIRLTAKSEQSIAMFAQLWRQAAAAKENLGRLPYNHSVIDSTLNFLSQTSDFAYTMMNKNIDGEDLTDEDWQKLEQLYEYSKKFSDELNTIASEVVMGNNISWEKINAEEAALEKVDSEVEGVQLLGSMSKVNQEFQEYPSLIYDGPFSAHIKTMEPLMTKDAPQITKEEGIEVVKKFLQYDDVAEVRYLSETDSKNESVLPIYTYQAVLKDASEPTVYVDITQKGGHPLLMLNYTDTTGDSKITLEQARQKAKNFLDLNGYPGMEPSYYENADGVAVINFAPVKDGITMYPDLIKVKVDMKSDVIVGFESKGYITMHYDREIKKPKLTEEDAKKEISTKFNIEAVKKCIIPLESKSEVLCYEFKGTYGEDSFLIYINANTGKQEKILQLLISDNAIMTQ